MEKALDIFGEIIMTRVRDRAILEWDKTIEGRMKDVDSQEIFKDMALFNDEQLQIIRKIIPKIVDTTIHHLLWTLEQTESVNIAVKVDNKLVSRIQDISDGSLFRFPMATLVVSASLHPYPFIKAFMKKFAGNTVSYIFG